MIVRALLIALGLFHAANGFFMLFAPVEWYAAVPGVTLTGPFNGHFIQDIGMAFIASGAGLILSARRGMALLACAGAAWPALHALIHLHGWTMHGIAPGTVLSEIVGVAGLATLGVALAWLRARGES